MKVPYSWLCTMLPGLPARLKNGASDLEPVLARLGLPVEELIEVFAPPEGVVFGTVISVESHTDELKKLTVDLGAYGIRSVITGAEDVHSQIGVAVALPGTQLVAPRGLDMDGQGLTIEVRVIQGTESWGMCCSARELGIGEDGSKLLELPFKAAQPGTPLAELWPGDSVLDIEITPNRADCLSVLGIARDLAAALELELQVPLWRRFEQPAQPTVRGIEIHVQDPLLCDRFVLRQATGLKIGPSPIWLQRRLMLCGVRVINNIVDSSNYVMLELGQPTAVYDAGALGHSIVVARAPEGYVLKTLDGIGRTLSAADLVIDTLSDMSSEPNSFAGALPIGVAGVIGAEDSSVSDKTTDIVLEAAHFDPVSVRLTGRRLGLKTDALYRFERGVDPNLPLWAADRYMELILESAGGEFQGGTEFGVERPRTSIPFSPSYANDLLGTAHSELEMRRALERLGCLVEAMDVPTIWTVRPPTHRVDLELEEDLIEEVARILGYDTIPERLPGYMANDAQRGADAASRQTRKLKDVLAGLGFQEIVSYSFTSEAEARLVRAPLPELRLKNPQSLERTMLRSVLYPGLLSSTRVNRTQGDLMLFEIGRVFARDHEEERLALLLAGSFMSRGWTEGSAGGFYAFKGLLEALALRQGDQVALEPLEGSLGPHLHPGVAARVFWNGQEIGQIGALHPEIVDALGLPADVFLAELRLPLPQRAWSFIDPSRQPAATRDLAVVMPVDVPYARLAGLVRANAGVYLELVEPFDVYVGIPIPQGQRSIALRLSFRAPGRTLTDVEVDEMMANVISSIRQSGFEIRDS